MNSKYHIEETTKIEPIFKKKLNFIKADIKQKHLKNIISVNDEELNNQIFFILF